MRGNGLHDASGGMKMPDISIDRQARSILGHAHPSRRRRSSLFVTLIAAASLGATQPRDADALALNNDVAVDTNALHEIFDRADTMPNVVWVHNCTGTLINSRTILTASHCFMSSTGQLDVRDESAFVSFSPDKNVAAPESNVRITGVRVRDGYRDEAGGNDVALVSLDRPITSITPVRLVSAGDAVPGAGTLAYIVGYGEYGTGLDGGTYSGGAAYDARRRIGQTLIGGYVPFTYNQGRDPGDYNMLVAQFRNPDSPDSPDLLGLNALGYAVPALQAGNGAGDSGGPLFILGENGQLIQIGVLGLLEPAEPGATIRYGSISGWEYVRNYLDWVNGHTALRAVSAQPGDGLWSDPWMWSQGTTPNNIGGNLTAGLGATGRYYDVALAAPSRLVADMSAEIDSLQILHPNASLSVQSPTNLSVLLDTTLAAGMLTVDGHLQTGRLLQLGGVVSGTGSVGIQGGFINQSGIVAPGGDAALGVLVIDGQYVQGAGGTLDVRTSTDTADRLSVSGTADLDGRLNVSGFGTAPVSGQTFSVLDAGHLIGNFSAVTSSLAAFSWTVSQFDNAAFVSGTVDYRNVLASNPSLAPAQQAQIASAADAMNIMAATVSADEALSAAQTTRIGDLPAPTTIASGLAGLNTLDAGQLSDALLALGHNTPDTRATLPLQTSRLMSGVLTDRLSALEGDYVGSSGKGARLSGSMAAYGQQKPSSNAFDAFGSAQATAPAFGAFLTGSYLTSADSAQVYALTGGIDTRVGADLTLGMALTYASNASGAQSTQAIAPSLYGRFNADPIFVDGYVGAAFGDSQTSRAIPYGNRTLVATTTSHTWQAMAGGRIGTRLDAAIFDKAGALPATLTITPFLGLDIVHGGVGSAREEGVGPFGRDISGYGFTDTRGSAGVEMKWDIALANAVLTPRLKASITQRFGSTPDPVGAWFTQVPGISVDAPHPAQSRNYATFGGSLTLKTDTALAATVSYEAIVERSDISDSRFSAHLNYRF